MNTKQCTLCKEEKALSEFYKNVATKDGKCYRCKACTYQLGEKWRLNMTDKQRQAKNATTRKFREKQRRAQGIRPRARSAFKAKYVGHRQPYTQEQKDHRRELAKATRGEQLAATMKLRRAVKRGVLVRPDMCGACSFVGKIEAHHKDYTKPLDVIWLCRACHVALHSALK